MSKGQFTLIITSIITLMGFFLPKPLDSFFFTIGTTGIIGCATNVLAIKMLFDRIYLLPKWKKFPLPYSGILELEREKIALAIGWVVSKRLVSPDAIMRMMNSQDFQESSQKVIQEKLCQVANDEIILGILIQDIKTILFKFIDSKIFRNQLQGNFYKHLGKVGIILVKSNQFRQKELVTPYIQKEIKNILNAICCDPLFYDKMRNIIENLPSRILSLQSLIRRNIQFHGKEIVKELLEKLELDKIVASEIAKFESGEMSHLVLKITAENLDWLEVWGGFLGVVGGIAFWLISNYSKLF